MIVGIAPEHYFVLKSGRAIKDLKELVEVLKTITPEEFNFHVNDSKNDFYNWIRYVFKAKNLAEDIEFLKYADRKKIIKLILHELQKVKVLVVNGGSSSLKFQILELKSNDVIAKGIVDAIGLDRCKISLTTLGATIERNVLVKNHDEAIKLVLDILLQQEIIGSVQDITAVGHRVVHGAESYNKATIITQEVISKLEEHSKLAPLHNPPNIACIKACMRIIPAPQVAVFDTAFHSTIPKYKYLYGLPYEYYSQHKIRKYGFHGSSHKYVTNLMKEYFHLKHKKNFKLIICHLGNGASITAVANGKSINNTMGFTPTDGLIMGTRVGSLDPCISIHIGEMFNKSYEDLNKIFNKQSGLLGISGYSDMRDIRKNMIKNKMCRLALDMFVDRIVHYIGAYIAELNGIDGIVFTAGIGENAHGVRKQVLKNFGYLGIRLDEAKNLRNEFIITRKDSKVECFVIGTNEEVQIAKETAQTLKLKI